MPNRKRSGGLIVVVLVSGLAIAPPGIDGAVWAKHDAAPPDRIGTPARHETGGAATTADLDSLHAYIRRAWSTLTRNRRDLAAAAVDPKVPARLGRRPVYVSRRENLKAVTADLAATLSPAEFDSIVVRRLPSNPDGIVDHGLLYLPRPYVVPGGRFNEMYGWDSYFILRGLLRDGHIGLARDLVDNLVYQVAHFGKVLNANRTYYLQRSQPPFLTPMIRAVYAANRDRAWLATTVPAIRTQYRYWTSPPHLAGTTGLSRYHALGAGPAPEVEAGERDAHGRSHYDRVRAEFRSNPPAGLDLAKYYDRRRDRLTPHYYRADRSMRESGFDPSDRFGRFSVRILDYAPVCLNSLLFAMERDMVAILGEIGGEAEASTWARRAEQRERRIRDLLWDGERALFADYDFVNKRRRLYPFAATFFPLWVGVATQAEARRLAGAVLPLLVGPGGLVTSTNISGNQWDAPFGWAPLQLVAVEGLRRYALDGEADGIALAFLGTVLKEFVEHGSVFEKYDVERRESDVSPGLRFGYSSNEVGFGWTNGVFLELEAGLSPARRSDIVKAARGGLKVPP